MGGRSHQQPSLGGGPLKVAACRVAAAAGESSTGFLPLLGCINLEGAAKQRQTYFRLKLQRVCHFLRSQLLLPCIPTADPGRHYDSKHLLDADTTHLSPSYASRSATDLPLLLPWPRPSYSTLCCP